MARTRESQQRLAKVGEGMLAANGAIGGDRIDKRQHGDGRDDDDQGQHGDGRHDDGKGQQGGSVRPTSNTKMRTRTHLSYK